MLFNLLFFRKNDRDLSDLELVARYQESADANCVGILYERYSHLALGVCFKYLKNEADSKDAVVNVFEKLLVDLKSHTITNFKSWLYMVVKNHCLMKIRAEKKTIRQETDIDAVPLTAEISEEKELAETKERQLTALEDAIQNLKPDQRACIELFYIQEKCYQEVADITGFPMKKVKSYIQNGKRNLKLIMIEQNESIYTT